MTFSVPSPSSRPLLDFAGSSSAPRPTIPRDFRNVPCPAVKQRGREKKGPPDIAPNPSPEKGQNGSGVAPANQTQKSQFMNFSQGRSGTKVQCESCFVFLRKNTRIHKNGRNSWTFRFGPFFGLVCQGDSWMVLCSFHRSDREICTRNRPLSETKFLDDFWGPLPLPAPLVYCWLACALRGVRVLKMKQKVRNTLSTAGNSMTSSERPSPEPLLKKEAPPAVLGGR